MKQKYTKLIAKKIPGISLYYFCKNITNTSSVQFFQKVKKIQQVLFSKRSGDLCANT